MDDAELCRVVSTEVMGWDVVAHAHTNRTTAWKDGKIIGNGLTLTGNDALRVIERMKAGGFTFSCRYEYDLWEANFWDGDSAEDVGEQQSFPCAVFRAALAAKRSQHG